MQKNTQSDKVLQESPAERLLSQNIHRRSFFKYTGAAAAASALLLTGCKDDDDDTAPNTGINLGSGDIGVLNYAYALEQLEAAFYTQVIANKYSGMTSMEEAVLTDIRDHEIAHREFFKVAIDAAIQGGASGTRLPDLTPDFSAVDFTSKNSVLSTAKTFEDLGVAAYNGAGKLISNGDYLLIAGKIVSVEARHAAEIRDMISNGSFADNTQVDANGLDKAMEPSAVLAAASPFIKEKLNGNNLPTA